MDTKDIERYKQKIEEVVTNSVSLIYERLENPSNEMSSVLSEASNILKEGKNKLDLYESECTPTFNRDFLCERLFHFLNIPSSKLDVNCSIDQTIAEYLASARKTLKLVEDSLNSLL